MADDDKQLPRGSSSPASPGIGGAIKDAVGALANAFGPRSIVQRKKKLDQAVDQASDSPQTTDLGNQF